MSAQDRFRGPQGSLKLVAALQRQRLIQYDKRVAEELAGVAKLRQLQKGNRLLAQGNTDADLYFIISGEVVVKVNGREVARRYAGNHVGEMVLLDPANTRSASVHAAQDTLVARVSEAAFTKIADRYPLVWRSLAVELGERLRQRGQFHVPPNDRPTVFIGSSWESVRVARALARGLRRPDVIVRLWTSGVFRASETSIESLCALLDTSDFAVLVLGADDVVSSRGRKKYAPRDNVVFELGLFLGVLGRRRTFFLAPRGVDLKFPSDLLGVTPLTYDTDRALSTAVRQACVEVRRSLKELSAR